MTLVSTGDEPVAPVDPGLQPPSILSGLPLADAGSASGGLGTVGGTSGLPAPQASAQAGSSSGAGKEIVDAHPSGAYEISAIADGFRIRNVAANTSADFSPEQTLKLKVDDMSDLVRGNSSVTIVDPLNWMFVRPNVERATYCHPTGR